MNERLQSQVLLTENPQCAMQPMEVRKTVRTKGSSSVKSTMSKKKGISRASHLQIEAPPQSKVKRKSSRSPSHNPWSK